MTTITIATIESVLRNRIVDNGTILVRVPQDTLAQMNDIIATMVEVTQYDESRITADDLEMSLVFAEHFNNSSLGSKIIDGRLAPEDDAVVNEALITIKAEFAEMPMGAMLPVVLVNKILNDVKHFAI